MEHVLTPYNVSTEYLFPISYNRKIPKVPKYVDLRSPKVNTEYLLPVQELVKI